MTHLGSGEPARSEFDSSPQNVTRFMVTVPSGYHGINGVPLSEPFTSTANLRQNLNFKFSALSLISLTASSARLA